ncbi:uncharacterized protein LOC143917410 [Arctopsyche grandis]|uniref:uncharacterized protein LOC143917410 n=1 Tax=Arctopsyche grandis TaxID=121162 RepID=UPI00406D7CFA
MAEYRNYLKNSLLKELKSSSLNETKTNLLKGPKNSALEELMSSSLKGTKTNHWKGSKRSPVEKHEDPFGKINEQHPTTSDEQTPDSAEEQFSEKENEEESKGKNDSVMAPNDYPMDLELWPEHISEKNIIFLNK